MERKILWVLSFLVIFILWLKLEPIKQSQSNDQTVVDVDPKSQIDEDKGQPNIVKEPPVKDKKDKATPQITGKAVKDENSPPDFAKITDTQEKKDTFFHYLLPYVIEKNALLIRDREKIYEILNNKEPPSREDKRWLKALRGIFRLEKVDVYTHDIIRELLPHVDIIPESLALAQAANESAWGTSRFALEGNNYFGQWCFRKGCGLVPVNRDYDADHEVKRFKNAKESVFAYIDNLNINAAYKDLRKKRSELRSSEEPITGIALASGLLNYSQRGQDYIDEIEELIRYNKLWKYNQKRDTLIEK
ncbi:glucosaminidase domain-containing protein [Marinomonas sp. 2405UD68-3]|uniref:glucosaminidase domain-containing protein n=1 Tax=Marinomonas sp. 2405UD68-3 TaxID=3391835 RepID=UPI0039C8D4B7